MPNKEENKIIKPISFICKSDNCNLNVFPGVNKDGTKMARKAITTARAMAIKTCFLELKTKKMGLNTDKMGLNTDFTILLSR